MTECHTAPVRATDDRHIGFWGGMLMGAAGTLAAAVASGPLVFGFRLGF